MQAFELVAGSPLAKLRVTPNGPNILLNENIAIGRSAASPGNLPIEWAQVSGNHCRIFLVSKDPPTYHLEDNSTNGTAINGTRVPKGSSRPLVEGDHIRLAVATQDPNKVIEYIFRRVLVGKHANTAKRPLDCASPASDTKPAGKIAKTGTPEPKNALQTDTKVVHKLRQSNDELRQRVEAERQATVEACRRAKDLELQLKTERQHFEDQLSEAKEAASGKGVKELSDLKSRLAEAEAQAQRDAAACAEARQEASKHQAAAEKAHKEIKQLAKERDELAQSVQSMEARHRAAHKALSAAEHSTRQELQSKAEELQRATEEKAAAQKRAHDEAVARSAAEQREQELQRDMWEVKLKLQRSEDACSAAEEKTLCLESYVREGLGSLGRANESGAAQWQLLSDLQTAAATFSGILGKLQDQGVATKDDMAIAKYNMECALSVRDAEPGRDPARPAASEQAALQNTQQPTQSTADGSAGSGPAGFRSPTRSLATQPRSPPPQLLAPSPTLAAVAEATQPREVAPSDEQQADSAPDAAAIVADSEAAAVGGDALEEASADAVQPSSFVLNHLIGAQPRSSVNTPSFGNGSALQQPMSGSAHAFAATAVDVAGPTGEQEDADMQYLEGNDERENQPDNGAADGEKAGAPVDKDSSQRAAAHSRSKPTLQLSLQGTDRYGMQSHGDEFEDME